MAMAVVSAWQLALDCYAMCFYILSCVKKVQTVRGHPSQVIKVLSMVKPNCLAERPCKKGHAKHKSPRLRYITTIHSFEFF